MPGMVGWTLAHGQIYNWVGNKDSAEAPFGEGQTPSWQMVWDRQRKLSSLAPLASAASDTSASAICTVASV